MKLHKIIDLVSSRVYPGLERKPGGPDNWVEAAGGLPSYIERIAKHLHYEKGMSISRAIATAVNTVKRWARGGTVTKHGTTKRVSAKTIAQAAAALASWEAKKRAGSLALTDDLYRVIDLTEVSEEFAFDLLDLVQPGAGADEGGHAILSAGDIDLSKGTVDLQALAERANRVEDPEARAAARQSVIDLASTIAPRKPSGKAKDGRRSYKRQGKWGHGFVPLDRAAKESKAKGSPIAINRLDRIYKGDNKQSKGRAGGRSAGGRKRDPKVVRVDEKTRPGSESAKDIGQLRHSAVDAATNKSTSPLPKRQLESTKQTRIPERARQNWDEIPETLKTVRGGKRYVLAEFGGKQYVTAWIGGVRKQESSSLTKRKVMRSITMADALKMSESAITDMINNPRTPDHVKRLLRKSLRTRRKADNRVA